MKLCWKTYVSGAIVTNSRWPLSTDLTAKYKPIIVK